MTPRTFLDDVVQPNVIDLNVNYGNLRLAMNAVLSVDALAAHLYDWCKHNAPTQVREAKNDSHYRELLAQQNDHFRLLRDIAKAMKHVKLTQGQPKVSTAAQVGSRSLGWDEARWDEGRWGSPPQVVVKLNNGDLHTVEAVVVGALKFLQDEMTGLGV